MGGRLKPVTHLPACVTPIPANGSPMPTYEYKCEPCRVIYQTMHGMNENPIQNCPTCEAPVTRLISAPSLNLKGFSSPTEAKYSKHTESEHVAMEKVLLKDYEKIWLPPFVKDNPYD